MTTTTDPTVEPAHHNVQAALLITNVRLVKMGIFWKEITVLIIAMKMNTSTQLRMIVSLAQATVKFVCQEAIVKSVQQSITFQTQDVSKIAHQLHILILQGTALVVHFPVLNASPIATVPRARVAIHWKMENVPMTQILPVWTTVQPVTM